MAKTTPGTYPSNGLPCPACGGNQARIEKADSFAKQVTCPQCGYTCWLKHYRTNLKEAQLKKSISI